MWTVEIGIDTFSYYHPLTSKQKCDIMNRLSQLPGFQVIKSEYCNSTHAYSSDCFGDAGVKIHISRKKGSPWGLLVMVHPALVLGNRDRSALYRPKKGSEYQKIVARADELLEEVNIPCSIDAMKLYRVDVTANFIFKDKDLVDEYIRILKKSFLLPNYELDSFREEDGKAKCCTLANRHSHKQYCKSAAIFAYDKTAQLEMIGAFPKALMGKHVLRLEAQLRRKGMKKWVGEKGMDKNNWHILKKLGSKTPEILQWYLTRLQGADMSYVSALEAEKLIQGAKGKNNRERMQNLMRLARSRRSLTSALEGLQEKYDLTDSQCRNVLKQFEALKISPITLQQGFEYDKLPPLRLEVCS